MSGAVVALVHKAHKAQLVPLALKATLVQLALLVYKVLLVLVLLLKVLYQHLLIYPCRAMHKMMVILTLETVIYMFGQAQDF